MDSTHSSGHFLWGEGIVEEGAIIGRYRKEVKGLLIWQRMGREAIPRGRCIWVEYDCGPGEQINRLPVQVFKKGDVERIEHVALVVVSHRQ